MQTGYSSTTPAGLLLGAGVLFLGSNKFGVSSGGYTFDPAKEIRNEEFDGKSSPVVGLDWITGYAPTFAGTLKEVSIANLQRLEQNVAFNGASPNILTPKPAGVLLQTADYLQDLRLVLDTGDGQFHRIRFAYALCTAYSIKSMDKSGAEISATFAARLLPTGSPLDLSVAPYTYERATATP